MSETEETNSMSEEDTNTGETTTGDMTGGKRRSAAQKIHQFFKRQLLKQKNHKKCKGKSKKYTKNKGTIKKRGGNSSKHRQSRRQQQQKNKSKRHRRQH